MKKIRSRFSRVIGMAAAMSLLLCGNSAMAAFDVSDTNGYDRLIAEVDFEGYTNGAELPNGGSDGMTKTVMFMYPQKAWGGVYASNPVKAVTDPSNATGAENHNMVARLDSYPSNGGSNYLRLQYIAIDPAYNGTSNPTADFAKKHQLVKYEQDILWTSTDITGVISYVNYDNENVNGRGARASAQLMKFGNGTITVPFDTTDEPNARTATYEANRWYHLTFYVNSATGRFSFYLDDTLITENVRCWPDGKPGIMPLSFTTYLNAQSISTTDNIRSVYVDNIRYRALSMEDRTDTVTRTAFNYDFANTKYTTDNFTVNANTSFPAATVDSQTHGTVLRVNAYADNGSEAYVRPTPGLLTGSENMWDNTDYSGDALAAMQKVHVSMELYFSKYFTGYLKYGYYDSVEKGRKIGTALATFRNDGRVIYTPNQIVYYQPGRWYTFDLYFDLTARTYTAKIDGDVIVENAALPDENISYLVYVYFQFANWGNGTSDLPYVEIDNYKIEMVKSTATPKLNRAQFKEDGSYLAYAADTSADMIYARYNSDGKVLENCEISQGSKGDLRIMEIDGGEGANERLFWWQSDTLTPVDGLPSLPALPSK